MIVNTRAPGDTRKNNWSRIARSSPAERSDPGPPSPMNAGDGLLLMIANGFLCIAGAIQVQSDAQSVSDTTMMACESEEASIIKHSDGSSSVSNWLSSNAGVQVMAAALRQPL